MKYLKSEYKLIGFRKSKRVSKKYDGIIKNNKTGKLVYVAFGSTGYSTYSDKTGLNLYDIHNDKQRLRSYRLRFRRLITNKDFQKYYSPIWFSTQYLW